MNLWHGVDRKRITSKKFIACIEITKGSKNKYELDKPTGALILDRILFTSTHYPQNYGFIPRTLSGDGDPLDVLVIASEPIISLSLVECYPIGVFQMIDNGDIDEKIIAICAHDPFYSTYQDITELPKHLSDEITHFFSVYKTLEGKPTVVHSVEGKEKAIQIIEEAIEAYEKKYGNQE